MSKTNKNKQTNKLIKKNNVLILINIIMQSINQLYEYLKTTDVEKLGGRLDPSRGMPNMRYIFNNGNGKFDTLSIMSVWGGDPGYETILKKGDDCVYLPELDYDDVNYFETADEVEKEIKRILSILNTENQPH